MRKMFLSAGYCVTKIFNWNYVDYYVNSEPSIDPNIVLNSLCIVQADDRLGHICDKMPLIVAINPHHKTANV